jgi:hypothetical protein
MLVQSLSPWAGMAIGMAIQATITVALVIFVGWIVAEFIYYLITLVKGR